MNLVLEPKQLTDFCPVDFGQEVCLPGKYFGPHVRDYYLIHYVSAGRGVFQNPRKSYQVTEGQAFLIRPGEVCKYTADLNHPWVYTWIGFLGNMAPAFDRAPDVFEADGLLFEEMLSVDQFSSSQTAFLAGTLFKLYCSLFDEKEKPDYVNRTIGYININYMKPIRVEQIADLLGINRKYLARIFKEKTGNTMQQYLIQKRVAKAKRLLSRGFNVEETAFMVGYTDSFTFSKIFKKYCGVSPKHYQKSCYKSHNLLETL